VRLGGCFGDRAGMEAGSKLRKTHFDELLAVGGCGLGAKKKAIRWERMAFGGEVRDQGAGGTVTSRRTNSGPGVAVGSS